VKHGRGPGLSANTVAALFNTGMIAPVQGINARALSIDGVLEQLYRRFGARYLDAMNVVILLALLGFVVPVYAFLVTEPWHPSTAAYVRCALAYAVPMALVGFPGVIAIARRMAAPTYAWAGGRRGPDEAPAAWASTVAGLPRWILVSGLWYSTTSMPGTLYTAATLDFSWEAYPIYLACLSSLVVVFLALVYLFSEQWLRPVAREIAAELPADSEPPRSVMTLSVKALVLIPAINFFSAVVVGSLVTNHLKPELQLGHIVLLALAVSLTVSLVLTLMFRNSLVRRVEDLREAMVRVDEGDLGTRVPPVAGDELDEMGATFNDMVAGLRERESLRHHNAELVADLRRQAEQLRESRKRIVAASHAARRRVERDLHDGAQQRLVLLGLKLGLVRTSVEGDPATVAAFDELREELDRALAELRELARGIYPTILENDGLPAALRDAAGSAAIPTGIECDAAGRYSAELEAAVYFCCIEALQNAAKHAGAGARAQVSLAQDDGVLAFAVADDGKGFDPRAAAASMGLQNMADRIGALGGTLSVESVPGAGTRITGTIPATPN
jgi:signal transduction histidine kinase